MAWLKVRALVVGAVTVLCLPMTAHTAADPTKVLRVSSHDIASLDPVVSNNSAAACDRLVAWGRCHLCSHFC
jgi:hypothetical protein